jgi:hypothetical protein
MIQGVRKLTWRCNTAWADCFQGKAHKGFECPKLELEKERVVVTVGAQTCAQTVAKPREGFWVVFLGKTSKNLV